MRIAVLACVLACAVSEEGLAQRTRPATRDALMLAEDRRASRAGDYELLAAAADSHPDAALRAQAVRALGRLEQSQSPSRQPAGIIERALGDADVDVRRAAAYALAQSVIALDAAAKAPRRAALLSRLSSEQHDAAAAAMLESVARLTDAASVPEAEAAVLAQAARGTRGDAVASALEILARRAGKPGVLSDRALEWLRAAVGAPGLSPAARRAALQALATARAVDVTFAARAFASDDWQIRRLAVAAAPASPEQAPLVDRALRDPDAHVRYEAVRHIARRGPDGCVALVSAMKDADPHVALAAIDAVGRCADPSIAVSLAALAANPGGLNWHRASHALVTLAAADARRARELLTAHAADPAWPVRMYAATAAARLADEPTLVKLASDAHPNVREAVIAGIVARVPAARPGAAPAAEPPQPFSESLSRILKDAVRAALSERRDPQLLRTAATAVAVTGDAASFKDALSAALDAVDAGGIDTAIDARTALADALRLAAPGAAIPAAPRAREPLTPSAQELAALPSRARIEMARGGVIELELLPEEAPAAVARFARLARAGYYDGLTFHRVVPNFVVQGGSPWANEYAGAARFQRDELGFARHDRGAVGISTRGRDTGDAQIFIDLVDLPRLNHDYTVFARVVSGMEAVDQILEADVIQRITILK